MVILYVVFGAVIASILVAMLAVYIYYQNVNRDVNVNNTVIASQTSNTPLYDAFGRARISQPFILFESKQNVDNDPLNFDENLMSGSITSTWSGDRASTTLTATGGTSGKYIRQSFRRFEYQAGKSQQIMLTANVLRNSPTTTTGVSIALGSFDDNNGLYFEYDNGTMYCVIKSSVSGTPTVTRVAQSDWNLDKLDGKGESGVIGKWDKVQIYTIDYAWLGVGRVRYGLIIGGEIIYVHQNLTANIGNSVYLSNPNLPIRYQITATSDTVQDIQTEIICCAVSAEGGDQTNVGFIRTHDNLNTVTIPNENYNHMMIAIRLKKDNISSTILPLSANIFNEDTTADVNSRWSLIFDPDYSSDPTWVDLDNSSIQYANGPANAGISVTGGTKIITGFTSSGFKGSGSRSNSINLISNILLLGTKINGTRQTLALTNQVISNDTTVPFKSSLTWKELT